MISPLCSLPYLIFNNAMKWQLQRATPLRGGVCLLSFDQENIAEVQGCQLQELSLNRPAASTLCLLQHLLLELWIAMMERAHEEAPRIPAEGMPGQPQAFKPSQHRPQTFWSRDKLSPPGPAQIADSQIQRMSTFFKLWVIIRCNI